MPTILRSSLVGKLRLGSTTTVPASRSSGSLAGNRSAKVRWSSSKGTNGGASDIAKDNQSAGLPASPDFGEMPESAGSGAIRDDPVDPVEQPVHVRPPAAGREGGQALAHGRGGARRRLHPAGRGPVQHPQVPVPPGRLPPFDVEYQVVVGQLDRAGPPAVQRLGHGDLELTRGRLLVEAAHPG